MNAIAARRTGLDQQIAALLASGGVRAGAVSVTTCSRGANNRIHRVETADAVFAVKEYFRHTGDPRDRLAAETAFLKYANEASPGATAQLFASDAGAGMALVEFISGRPLRADEVDAGHIDTAINFFRDLNVAARRSTARLPIASEATFSITDQLAVIDARVGQLLVIEPQCDADVAALGLARRLRGVWVGIADRIRRAAQHEALDEGGKPQRCISPSDFGFHNALITAGGDVRFIDFEYAGWDDPTKTVGDFFAQLAVPVPVEHFERFVQRCMEVLPEPGRAARRATLLRPAYEIKWCCIALNVFLPVHLARRRFANPELDEDALKRTQIEKAERLVERITQHAH